MIFDSFSSFWTLIIFWGLFCYGLHSPLEFIVRRLYGGKCCVVGKFVPDDAVNEMKANYVLPHDGEDFVDEIWWIELPREQCIPLVQM